jgi:uncharacterized membrane protein YbhN (UPF0104 family)/phosphatidylglycerophosphate synthase
MTAAFPPADSGRAPLSTPRRASGLTWTSIALSVGLVLASIGLADSRRVLAQLERVDTRWLGVAFFIGLVQLGLLGLRWSRLARALGLNLGWLKATMEYALSLLGNQVLPSGIAGDGLRAIRHARSSPDTRLLPVVEALALDRASGQLALWLVVLASLPFTIRAGIVDVEVLGLCLLGLAGSAALLWFTLSRVTRWQAARARGARALRRLGTLLLSPRGMLVHLPLSLVLVGLLLLQLWVAARAIGIELPWLQLLWLGPLILVAASVPSFFGGWGVREGASALLFAAAGLPQSTGVAVSMVYGAFSLVISLPGLFVLLFDSERARASLSPPWVHANALSMLLAAPLALWFEFPPLLAFVSALSFFILVAQTRGAWTRGGGFGLPNAITTLRLLLTLALLLGFEQQSGLSLALTALVVVLLDVGNGWVGRRRGLASEFGARYDMAVDSLLVLTLAVLLFSRGGAGPWVLTAGLWRYLYVLAPVCFPAPLPEARHPWHGRFVYALILACSMVALCVGPRLSHGLALLGTVAVSLSFMHSFWQRYLAPVSSA